jgi:uncharacterized protein YbjT (DUF2867 family)
MTIYMAIYKDKQILVAGGTGLIGHPPVEPLLTENAQVTMVSPDDPSRAPIRS